MSASVLAVNSPALAAGTDSWRLEGSGGLRDGFNPLQDSVVDMCVFNSALFAGTDGCQVWRYDGSGWSLANTPGFGDGNLTGVTSLAAYGGHLYAAGPTAAGGCQVWRTNGSGGLPYRWTMVSSPADVGAAGNYDVPSMAAGAGGLYAGTVNGTGCRVWRYDGSSWHQCVGQGVAPAPTAPGFGNIANIRAESMTVSPAGVVSIGTAMGAASGCEVWSGSYTTWSRTNLPGFSNANNRAVSTMSYYGAKLYAATTNSSTGSEVWRYDGPGQSNWTAINKPGFGIEKNRGAFSLASYGGKLYAGTYNSMHTGCELYRYSGSGTAWSKIGASGMGDAKNITAESMAVYDDRLFIGTINWNTGCEVWSYDGSTLRQSNADGFGKVENRVVGALATDGSRLAAGVYNQDDGCEVWVTERPPSTWYLAEGTTAWGFDTYVTIENPNTSAVTADITYMTGAGAVTGGAVKLPAKSQATVNPSETLGQRDFSTKVSCREGAAICVDRTMRWTGPGAPSEEGHCSVGVTGPARDWYLAEGSTGWGFECWLLVQNPNATEARCEVTYMIEGEGPRTFEKTVPANSRATYNMAADIGQKDASIKVSANVPVIPERAMYRNNRREGHDSIGTTTPATDYFLAEGTTAWGFTTYVLVQNPNDAEATVTITYMTGAGPKSQAPFKMPAGTRKTVRVNDVLPDTDLSTRVSANRPIIAERAMYWGEGTPMGEACHDSIGMREPHSVFYLPDGETGNGRETWTLVQNPNPVEVSIEVTYMRPDGKNNVTFTDRIPADSRSTYNMADAGFTGRAAVMVKSKTAGRRIMVERAMYWNSRGAGTVTIGGYAE